ncbi:MAG: WD40 repeat protein [Mariniblastus sp.]|jgi:WD40 repeat protein
MAAIKFRVRLVVLVLLGFSGQSGWAQNYLPKELPKPLPQGERSEFDRKPSAQSDNGSEWIQQLEPGVLLYGREHRFAEVGNCQSFDVSPDGRTLVMGTGKIEFFDLIENRVTDKLGEPNEHYQNVAMSPDGRLVFGYTGNKYSSDGQKPGLVRVYNAISKEPEGTILIESEKPNFHVQNMVVSADGTFIALYSHNMLQVRNVKNGELVLSLSELGYIQGNVAFSPDESELFVPKQGKLEIYDLASGEKKDAADSKLSGKRSSGFSINLARSLIAMPQSGGLVLYDIESGESRGIISLPKIGYSQSCVFSDDGELIALDSYQPGKAGNQRVIKVVHVDTKKVLNTFRAGSQSLTKYAFSVDKQSVYATGHGIFGVQELRLDVVEKKSDAKSPSGPAAVAVLHPSGESFVTSSSGGEITWFNAEDGTITRSRQKPNTSRMELVNDGSELLLTTKWNGGSRPVTRISYADGEPVKSYSLKGKSKNGLVKQIRSFLTTGATKSAVQAQVIPITSRVSISGEELNSLSMEMTYEMVHTVAEDGTTIGNTYQQSSTLRFQQSNLEDGKKIQSRVFDPGDYKFRKNSWMQTGGVHPDGHEFAIVDSRRLVVIDVETGDVISDQTMPNQIRQVAYSRTGKFLFVDFHQGTVVYETATGDEVKRFESRHGACHLAFSKDDVRMVLCPTGASENVEVFDTRNWKSTFSRGKTQANRTCISISDDGQKLLVGLADCRMEMWDLALIK